MKTKEELKVILANSLYYILNDSPLKKYHQDIYQQAINEFNLILARESK